MGIIFLFLFGITLFVEYIAIRRGWGNVITTASIGAILSLLFVVLFALLYEDTSRTQAILSGVIVGLGFSGAVAIIASFFRTNQPSADVQLGPIPTQEEKNSGQGLHRH